MDIHAIDAHLRLDVEFSKRTVPVTRLFMIYWETAAMNQQYQEAEILLLCNDESGPVL